MKIGVISDTHGDMPAISLAVAAVGAVDLWIHAGDYSQDGSFLAEITGVPVVTAAGNCDGHTAAKIDEFITIANKKIWVTHGHRYKVKYGEQELLWWARQYEVDIVVYGHTHVADITWQQELLIFNPGSASSSRCNNPTCSLLEINGESGSVDAKIFKLE